MGQTAGVDLAGTMRLLLPDGAAVDIGHVDSLGRGGLGGLLSTSGTIFALPFLLSGALFLISSRLRRRDSAPAGDQPAPQIPAGSAP